MTNDVLQSDIALATRMVGERCSDEEILRTLAHRRVDPAKAAKVLEDLRSGRKPEAKSPLPSEMTAQRRSRSRSAAREAKRVSSDLSQPSRPAPKPTQRPTRPGGPNAAFTKVLVAGVLILGLATAGIVFYKRGHSEQSALDAGQTTPDAPRQAQSRSPASMTPTGAAGGSASAPLVLELEPDGLHMSGRLVTGGNLLTAMANLLGAPTRTNRAAPAGTVIYAYDRHGLLVYAQPGGGTNHIVLDCEATGGANGTTSSFAGTLKVEGQVIGPDTDSPTLAGIRKLGLESPKGDGTIWGGHYNSLGLVFAYLKSPRRPSLIEIDLK
jgi:hypothetical protein